jgi:hypothetical protein
MQAKNNSSGGKMDQILKELEEIEKKHGILKPEHVVKFAENPRTALHEKFTWDDSEAAQRWRLHEGLLLLWRERLFRINNPAKEASNGRRKEGG